MDWKFLFVSVDGRIGQKDFWIGALLIFVAGIVLGWIPLIGWLASLGLIWCWIAISAKRLHDFNKSAWLIAIPLAVMMILGFISVIFAGIGMAIGSLLDGYPEAAIAGGMMGMFGIMSLSSLVGLAFLLWVGLSKGDAGPNQYGPAPTRSQFDGNTPPPPPADVPPTV
ncbi:DUF805 domain-containing protein [Caulobacter sp. NIBR2454]|uniref:DUF805 domain-containing protein n=1 Tax=Caulobacter sp. NIBR2454 TaxID=3015996 RepID=UPI0022B70986|nr:DUF805 domain-containing protein [Caulobacter sp. NIBR2454]